MPTYKTPGVYIEEISTFPPSVAAVETAIPAFIGFTQITTDGNGNSLIHNPVRITSLLEFEQIFGFANIQEFSFDVEQTQNATEQITETKVTFYTPPAIPEPSPDIPSHFLYYSMQLFYANGGGPCYVVSIGDFSVALTQQLFIDAITSLEAYDEPTLLVFPDACLLFDFDPDSAGNEDNDLNEGNAAIFRSVIDAALAHCNKLQDRFTIIDVFDALPGKVDNITPINSYFRTSATPSDIEFVKYGAAYYPYLKTTLPFYTNDDSITINSHTVNSIAADGTITSAPGLVDPSNNAATPFPISDTDVKDDQTAIYNAIKQTVNNTTVTIPPSGAIAGVYARVDGSRGVWKAPANVSLSNVIAPAITITNDLNDGLNDDATSGKSVNAIRSFVGKGTLVWGARTLAGNDLENRYISVRRFLNFAEESIKKAITIFVFEPNNANTWTKVRSMIESFLTKQWRDGALAGAKPGDAFDVAVGLNKTMTAQDILEGVMIVEIRLAIVRPAEFIVLRFSQLMQQS